MATNTVPYGQSEPAMYPVNNLEPEYDLEKSSPKDGDVQAGTTMVTRDASEASSLSEGVTKPKARAGVFGKISEKLSSYGVEETGIERVLPNERSDQSPMSCFTMWMAANTTVSTFALGTLGSSIWQMGFKDAALTILFFNLFPTIVVAYFSTWGPETGLRQLALSRFGFGYFTVLLPTILNCIACIGWSTINSLAGAFCLQAVSMDSSLPTIPIAAAIVVIAVSTLAVSFMGYRVVHLYEKYSWYPPASLDQQLRRVIGEQSERRQRPMFFHSVLPLSASQLAGHPLRRTIRASFENPLPPGKSSWPLMPGSMCRW